MYKPGRLIYHHQTVDKKMADRQARPATERGVLLLTDHHGRWIQVQLDILCQLFAACSNNLELNGRTLLGLEKNHRIEQVIDLGFVGEPKTVQPDLLKALIAADDDFIPVIAPVGLGEDGERYNINADTAAGAIAGALGATRVLFLTDVKGVLDKAGNLIKEIAVGDIPSLIADGTATGGMIPKLETARHAVEAGAGASVILDGRIPHALLTELFTEHGSGTLIR